MKSIKLERAAPVYQDFGSKRMTNYYSALDAKDLLKSAVVISHLLCKNVELHADKYKVRLLLRRSPPRFQARTTA